MSSFPHLQASALAYRQALLDGDFSAVEGIELYLGRCREVDQQLFAATEWFPEEAMSAAREIAARLERGESPRALEGIPFTAKANISTLEGETHAGSKILSGFRAASDSTAVARIRAAGGILVGKTNQDEFGMGGSTEHCARPTRNPWDVSRVPGGSSGGAGALGGALGWGFHLGSDTGGSVRQPAAYCGATGFKPTYGRVSRLGLVAFGSSLDQIGVVSVDAADAEAVFQVMAGPDPLDSTVRREELSAPEDPSTRERPRRIGIPRQFTELGVTESVVNAVAAARQELEAAGHQCVEVSLPLTQYANACYQVVSTAEAASNLSRYDGMRFGARAAAGGLDETYRQSRSDGFGEEVKRRILIGTFVLSSGYYEAYYGRALKVRQRLREEYRKVFEDVDVLLGPTAPNVAFRVGEKVSDPLEIYACDVLTVSASLGGLPAISVPAGLDPEGLPIGLQIMGPELGDGVVLSLARHFQTLTDHHGTRAPIAAGGEA